METKTFTEKESLTLISEMIEQAKANLRKGSGNAFIFYGLIVSCLALANVALLCMLPNGKHSFWIWALMLPAMFIGRHISNKVVREAMVKTHIDTIIHAVWQGFAYAIALFLLLIFTFGFGQKMYSIFGLINPVILLLMGLAEFITARVCRHTPYLVGALIMWLGALLCIAVYWLINPPVLAQFVLLAICMITGFVVPGYRLNKMANDHV
jgi:hypothetical protein